MHRIGACLTALLLATTAGCGGASGVPYNDDSRDPEKFAVNVKQMVLTLVEEARTSREPADQLEGIVSTFEGRFNRLPVGDYRGIYEELHLLAGELHAKCEAVDGRPPGLEAALDEITAVASRLPGDVTPSVPPEP